MKEASKSKIYWGSIENTATSGYGIDIGCGPDPVKPDVRRFDVEHGDANKISQFVKDQFDFVYSSHCLEHMHNPRATILDWWKLVKPGGYLFVIVPDEDLYEQGVFPSRFNTDHKATFTISKAISWSPTSVNMLDLAQSLPDSDIVSLQLQDRNYDRLFMSYGILNPSLFIRLLARCRKVLSHFLSSDEKRGVNMLLSAFYPYDQTNSDKNAQAQIQLIARKHKQ